MLGFDDEVTYTLSPAQLHAILREKFRLFAHITSELDNVLSDFELVKQYGDDEGSVPADEWQSYRYALDVLEFAAEDLAREWERPDDWFEWDDGHDCLMPFRLGRTYSKSDAESAELLFDNGHVFPSYHDAAGFYNQEFEDELECRVLMSSPEGSSLEVIPAWPRLLGKIEEISKWKRFFDLHFNRFIAGMNAEAAGALRFFGEVKFNTVPVGSAKPKRDYNRFAKACPKCQVGKMTVGTKKKNGVRHLYCKNCDHSEKAVRRADERSNHSPNGTQLEQ